MWLCLHNMYILGQVFSLVFALDEMGTRIDDLEKNVVELMTQAGMEEQASSKWQQAHSSSARWAVTSGAKKKYWDMFTVV